MSDSFATPWTARLFCPWNFSGKNTGEGSHSLLSGIFQTQGLNPGLLHCRQVFFFFFPSEPPGKNWVSLTQDLGVVAAAVTVPLSVSNRWTWDQDHWGCPEGGSMGEVAHRKHWGIPSSIQVVTAVRCVCVGRCLAPPYHCYHPMWTTISLPNRYSLSI